MTKQPLGKKALFKTVLDVLLEAKNVRISYVYEYELVTWLVTWLHGYKISQRYVENSEFYVLKKKSSIKQYLLNISLLKHDIWQEESMEWALNLHVAAPCLDSQFALLQKIVVLVTWKLVLSLLRHPLFSEQIIL